MSAHENLPPDVEAEVQEGLACEMMTLARSRPMPEPRNPLEVVEEALARAVDTPGLWCRGDESLGTACGKCSRCGLCAALTLLRKVRAGAVVGWVEGGKRPVSDVLRNDLAIDGHTYMYADDMDGWFTSALLIPFTDTETRDDD